MLHSRCYVLSILAYFGSHYCLASIVTTLRVVRERISEFDHNLNVISILLLSNSETYSNGLRTFICTVSKRWLCLLTSVPHSCFLHQKVTSKIRPRILLSAMSLQVSLLCPASFLCHSFHYCFNLNVFN
jgi:hypothetical protein